MKEEESKYIDDLFREGLQAENDQVPYRESDWEKLEQRLNRYDRRKGIIFWLRPLGGVAALLLLAFAGWWLWPEKEQPIPQQVTSAQEAEEKEEKHVEEPGQAESTISLAEAEEGKVSGVEEPKQIIAVSPVEQRELQAGNVSVGTDRGEMSPIASRRGSWSNLVAESEVESVSKLDRVKLIKRSMPPAKIRDWGEPLKLEDEPGKGILSVTVLAAPAYNGVNNLNNAKIGGDFGLLFSMAVTKRWSVSTGAIYGLKLYETDGENYQPPQSDGYGHDPLLVNADCRVLDVPLNIDYKLLNFPKTSFSLGTGVSSYFMLSEKYSYQYAYGPEEKDAVSLKNNSIHWVSVLNLQANLERELSPRISISLRPYLKIPFQDIGYGRVRLQSFGMALSTSWNF